MKVVSTVIHALNLNPGMRKTPSWSAAKPSAEPRDPPARMRKERESFSGRLRPKTFFASPGAAFATPPALLERTRGGAEAEAGKRKRRQKKAGKGGVFVEGAGSRRRDRRFRGRPKPSAASRSRRRAGASTSRARPRALRGSGEVSRDSFARARGSRTHHTRALRPAADCTARDARTEAPVIILRAPKRTAEVEAAGATAARAWTRAADRDGRLRHDGRGDGDGSHESWAGYRRVRAHFRVAEKTPSLAGRKALFFAGGAFWDDGRAPRSRTPAAPRPAARSNRGNDESRTLKNQKTTVRRLFSKSSGLAAPNFSTRRKPKTRKGLWLFFLSDDSSGKKIFFNASEVHPLTPTMTARRQL